MPNLEIYEEKYKRLDEKNLKNFDNIPEKEYSCVEEKKIEKFVEVLF